MKLKKDYNNLVENILNNEKFLLLKDDCHHGTNKYDHCKRVSYLSYIFAKAFKANKEEAARAGLLHDFFYGTRTTNEENSYLRHPLTSAINAKENFSISEKEIDIIKSHMYHYALVNRISPFTKEETIEYLQSYKPKDKESVIVCVSDLLISIYEVLTYKIRYEFCLYLIFIFNIIRY